MSVVSEIGEQWSPKTPPPRTAAITKYKLASSEKVKGTAMEIIMANVPQEVPVAKAIKLLIMNNNAGATSGISQAEVTLDT